MVTVNGDSSVRADTANFSCDPGFELVGDDTAICTATAEGNCATFIPIPTCHRKSFPSTPWSAFQYDSSPAKCPDPSDPRNGSVTTTTTSIGGVASYSCDSGFELSGVGTATCLQVDANNTIFSPAPPTCVGKSVYQIRRTACMHSHNYSHVIFLQLCVLILL